MTAPGILDDHLARVAEAFSRKSKIYDDFGRDHPNLTRMRRRVYAHARRCLKPGDRILELNAGTGADAAHFAELGYRVHAIDIAPGMLAEIEAKIHTRGLQDRLTTQALSFTDLQAVTGAPYQYVYSNFGGLNCVEDLARVARHLPRVLAPGGSLTWVIMPPLCPWELAQALRGKFKIAGRRLKRAGTLAHVEGVYFQAYYFTPRQVMRALGPDFRRVSLEGLSILTPPADHKAFATRRPRLYRLMVWLDERLARRPPFNGWGDFFILSARYEPA